VDADEIFYPREIEVQMQRALKKRIGREKEKRRKKIEKRISLPLKKGISVSIMEKTGSF